MWRTLVGFGLMAALTSAWPAAQSSAPAAPAGVDPALLTALEWR